jgi:hypothetical protein
MTTQQAVPSLVTQRAQALLGDAPTLTFQCDGGDGCSVRLVRARGGVWLGLAADRALFLERVRLGLRPRFVVHLDVDTPTLCGEASVHIVGRLGQAGAAPTGLVDDRASLIARMVEREPFGLEDLVVLEVTLHAIQLDDGEGAAHGAVPRT